MPKTNVICVVPVKNESWILENFIQSARTWADYIIIGDHNSTDASATIAKQYDFVKVIPLNNPLFDAGDRRRILFSEAQKIPGRRLIFAIDADEMISANWMESPEWQRMLDADPGTSFLFQWIELMPGLETCDIFSMLAAFVDDGTEYSGTTIHEPRIPSPKGKIVELQDIKLLHYIFVDPKRMISKHRWYKCVEYLEVRKRPWAICIMYQDTEIKSYDAPICPVDAKWIKGYDWLNEYRDYEKLKEHHYWYDEEVLNFFDLYGTKKFRKLNIWDVDWNKIARSLGKKGDYSDPRSKYEVWIHKFIEKNREDLKLKQDFKHKGIRLFGKTILRMFGW